MELVAAADLNPKVCGDLQRDFPGIRTFESHQAMFDQCPTDIVCVSTYAPSHEAITGAALKLPLKGILVEKPLGHTAASGRALFQAIQARRLPMAVPHGLLAKRTPTDIIQRVRSGEIGELKLVEMQCDKWDIINAGIHWFNFFVVLTGNEPVDYVMALCDAGTRTYRDGMQVETTSVTYVQTRSGIRGILNAGDQILVNRPGKDTLFRLVGTAGQIEFWGWENSYWIQSAKCPAGETVVPPEFPVTGHQRHLENMISMIHDGRADYTVPESSLMALEICEAAYLSSRHRCKVQFPFATFKPPTPPAWDPGMPYSGSGGGRDGRKL